MKKAFYPISKVKYRLLILFSILAIRYSAIGAGAPVTRIPEGYSVKTIDIPEHVELHVGGIDFMADGSALICTRRGELWKYDPGDDRWSLYANAMHEPLGVLVDESTQDVFVVQRGELTRLVDSNKDGVVDTYLNFNNDWGIAGNYHEFAFGPVRDSKGNFYGSLNLQTSKEGIHGSGMLALAPYRGCFWKIAPNGEDFGVVAWGLRSPAGVAINRKDELFYTDNQGDWIPSSYMNHVRPNAFFGHPASLAYHPDFKGKDLNAIPLEEYEKLRTRPTVWLPHGLIANSPGNPAFDETGGKFGPFEGQAFIGCQTLSRVVRVALDEVDGVYQGSVMPFVDGCVSGVIRNRFDASGALWLGQTNRGWQSVGADPYGLQTIAWDGRTVPFEILDVKIEKTGLRVRFTEPVDPQSVAQADQFEIEYWDYHYSGEYGSPRIGITPVAPEKCSVADDGMSVLLGMDLVPEQVYGLTLRSVKAANGRSPSTRTAYYTLNRLK